MLAAVSALLADTAAVETVDALGRHAVPSILLRGPVIARHFCPASEVRPYADVDLLVESRSREEAEAILAGLGFEHSAVLGQRRADRPRWSSTWNRQRDRATVDLHWALVGARSDSTDIWSALSSEIEPTQVLGQPIDGLNVYAAALVVVLHAAHHGPAVRRPVEDLERVIQTLDADAWRQVDELASRISAVEAFGAGLRLLESGAYVADALGLPATSTVETILRSESAPPTALGFDWLAQTPGVWPKIVLLGGKLVPDRQFMRAWSPVARRGTRTGLALAYAWRPIWLAWHSMAGLRAWRKAHDRVNR